MFALQVWLDRNDGRRETFTQRLVQKRSFSPAVATLLVSLLSSYSEESCKDPAVYQALIGHLDHDRLEIRHLAAYQLYEELADRLPRKARQIDYVPTDEREKRKAAVAKWRKIIPEGTLPSAPARPTEPGDG
jgi:hypothetical protein